MTALKERARVLAVRKTWEAVAHVFEAQSHRIHRRVDEERAHIHSADRLFELGRHIANMSFDHPADEKILTWLETTP
jgi:hypothetical protein